ncbi:MAG: hypothetical protein FD166_3446 [Bacteroidetes bacterium]|nr:MAG: hypothetical protein FD166_3446 [Bacteroidota bacterium]
MNTEIIIRGYGINGMIFLYLRCIVFILINYRNKFRLKIVSFFEDFIISILNFPGLIYF